MAFCALASVVLSSACAVQVANEANLCGRDHLGRELVGPAETGTKTGRQVGLFYYLWLGQHGTQGPYDLSKMEAADPNVMDKPDSPLWPDPSHAPMLHWGEPLFGYYQSTDEWVLRRHVQMFMDAGIDVLYFDTTNGYHYRDVTDRLFRILQEYHDRGFKVPKFCYYMAPARRGSGTSNVLDVWENYYSKGLYSDLYFKWNGKPLLIAHSDRPYRQEILDFFTWRKPTWCCPSEPDTWYWAGMPSPNVARASDGTPEMLAITVSSPHVAMDAPAGSGFKPGSCLGCGEGRWGAPLQGRSWHDGGRDGRANASHYGFFFADQIRWALGDERKDVPLAFVCQWNEWIVPFLTKKTNTLYGMRHWINLQDEYNEEYSRDIEPMKGGHQDAYYLQLMDFVRRFKGLPDPAKATRTYVTEDLEDWDVVSPVYVEPTGDVAQRDCPGYDACGRYVNRTGRNEFKALKVAVGLDGAVSFFAETVKPLTSVTDSNWMELFLRVPGGKVDGNGYTHHITSKTKGVTCRHEGNRIVYRIPAAYLGLDASKPFSLEFKWSDNRQSDDVMDFYVNGDAAPRGRLNYLFVFDI